MLHPTSSFHKRLTDPVHICLCSQSTSFRFRTLLLQFPQILLPHNLAVWPNYKLCVVAMAIYIAMLWQMHLINHLLATVSKGSLNEESLQSCVLGFWWPFAVESCRSLSIPHSLISVFKECGWNTWQFFNHTCTVFRNGICKYNPRDQFVLDWLRRTDWVISGYLQLGQ